MSGHERGGRRGRRGRPCATGNAGGRRGHSGRKEPDDAQAPGTAGGRKSRIAARTTRLYPTSLALSHMPSPSPRRPTASAADNGLAFTHVAAPDVLPFRTKRSRELGFAADSQSRRPSRAGSYSGSRRADPERLLKTCATSKQLWIRGAWQNRPTSTNPRSVIWAPESQAGRE